MEMSDWCKEAMQHLDHNNDLLGPWNMRYGYPHKSSRDKRCSRLDRKDRGFLELQQAEAESDRYHPSASATIIITIKGCWHNHVNTYFTQPTVTFAWGRVAADEAHKKQSNGGTIKIFKQIGDDVRKWMLTGTPFESSPAQMSGWLGARTTYRSALNPSSIQYHMAQCPEIITGCPTCWIFQLPCQDHTWKECIHPHALQAELKWMGKTKSNLALSPMTGMQKRPIFRNKPSKALKTQEQQSRIRLGSSSSVSHSSAT